MDRPSAIDPQLGCGELLSPPLVAASDNGAASATIYNGGQLPPCSGATSNLRALFTTVGGCAHADGPGTRANSCLGCEVVPAAIIVSRREVLVHSTIHFGSAAATEGPVSSYLDATLHLRTAPIKRNSFWMLAHHAQVDGSSEPEHWHFVHKCTNWSMFRDECRCSLLAKFRRGGCEIDRRIVFYAGRGDILEAFLYMETGGRTVQEVYSAGVVARRTVGVEGSAVSPGGCLSPNHDRYMHAYLAVVPREAMVRYAFEEDAPTDGGTGAGLGDTRLGFEYRAQAQQLPEDLQVVDDDFDEVVFDRDSARWSLSSERMQLRQIAREQMHVEWLAGLYRREMSDDKENKKHA